MSLDDWVPRADEETRHAVDIDAPPEQVWVALHEADFGESVLVRVLFMARGIGVRRADMAAFLEREFTVLESAPPTLLVLGMVGRPHRSQIDHVDPDEFVRYRRPGSVQIGWSFEVEPQEAGSRVTTRTRIAATDAVGLRRFRRYWRLIKPFSGLTRRGMLAVIKREAERAVRL